MIVHLLSTLLSVTFFPPLHSPLFYTLLCHSFLPFLSPLSSLSRFLPLPSFFTILSLLCPSLFHSLLSSTPLSFPLPSPFCILSSLFQSSLPLHPFSFPTLSPYSLSPPPPPSVGFIFPLFALPISTTSLFKIIISV